MDAFRDDFARVDIVLHPFLAPRDLPLSRFELDDYPSDTEILLDCRPVPWREVLDRTALTSLSGIDVALRSLSGALRKPDRGLQAQLEAGMTEMGLVPPDAGLLSPFVTNAFLTAMQSFGYRTLVVSDEWGRDRTMLEIETMRSGNHVPAHGVIETEDRAFLLVTHWDSCCSFLCRNDAGPIPPGLEGFGCTDRTQVFWGLYPM